MENLKEKFAHINGWGIDADPKNEPTYPIKKYTGDDHKRSNYLKPEQQAINVELLKSNERPSVSAVYGSTYPPSGLSGMIRRYAFKFSEDRYGHWLPLLMADRINVIEGLIDDIRKGYIPKLLAERGFKAEWKYNKKDVIRNVAVLSLITIGVIAYFSSKKRK